MTTQDSRPAQLAWLKWAAANPHLFIYSEGANRMSAIGVWPLSFPITADCSGFDTWIPWVAGGNDPNGLGFDHQGFTGTLLSHEEHLALWMRNSKNQLVEDVIPGDLVVYGPGTGEHVAMIVEVHNNDILTISFGDSQGPIYTWVNPPTTVSSRGYESDGRQPQTYLANVTETTRPLRTPADLFANPTAKELAVAGLVYLTGPPEAKIAQGNKWPIYYFYDGKFYIVHPNMPVGTEEYASKNYKTPNHAVSEE
jgi:hypothetical protein